MAAFSFSLNSTPDENQNRHHHPHAPADVGRQPPAISCDPKYHADALAIGATLRLVDGMNPGMATGPSGNYCIIMPQRFSGHEGEESSSAENVVQTPAPAPTIAIAA